MSSSLPSSLAASLRSLLSLPGGAALPSVDWAPAPPGAVAWADGPRIGLNLLKPSLLQSAGVPAPLAVFAGAPTCFAVSAEEAVAWRGVTPTPLADDPSLLAFDVQPGPALLVLGGGRALFVAPAGTGAVELPVPEAFAALAGCDSKLAPAPWVSAGVRAHLTEPAPVGALRAAAVGVRFWSAVDPASRDAARAALWSGHLPEPVAGACAHLRSASEGDWASFTEDTHGAVERFRAALGVQRLGRAWARAALQARDDLATDEAAFAVAQRAYPAASALAELDAVAAEVLPRAPMPADTDSLLVRLGQVSVDRPGAWWPAVALEGR